MPLFVVRVWLPDRPGALGAVASRIGAVRADVVGIDILERGAGRAVDELTIEIADPRHVDLLVEEIGQVDGVDVEHVRPVTRVGSDRAIESIAVARTISSETGREAILHGLVVGLRDLFDADWVAVVDPSEGRAVSVASGIEMPSVEWLAAFVIGSAAGDGSFAAVDELARVGLRYQGLELVLSREHLPLRESERSILTALADMADDRIAAVETLRSST